MSTLEQAIALAAKSHEGQKDRYGRTYILHPLRMMMKMDTETEMVAAVLHDIIEDCNVSLDDIRNVGFSEEVVGALDYLTRRRRESYQKYIARSLQKSDRAEGEDCRSRGQHGFEKNRNDPLEGTLPARTILPSLEKTKGQRGVTFVGLFHVDQFLRLFTQIGDLLKTNLILKFFDLRCYVQKLPAYFRSVHVAVGGKYNQILEPISVREEFPQPQFILLKYFFGHRRNKFPVQDIPGQFLISLLLLDFHNPLSSSLLRTRVDVTS